MTLNHLNITPTYVIKTINNNKVFIKRDDFIPFSFGGNKVRKALLFSEEIDKANLTILSLMVLVLQIIVG